MKLADGMIIENSEVLNLIDATTYTKSFKDNGYVVIDDILCESVAAGMYHFLNTSMDEVGWWYRTFYNQGTSEHHSDIEANKVMIDSLSKKVRAESDMADGDFFYIFRRTLDNHYNGCWCQHCGFQDFLKTPPLLKFISTVMGEEVVAPNEVFASCYGKGDFLSPHHDGMKGKVAFVLNLTKNWKPHYGGSLHFLSEDWATIENVFIPKYNSLILFKLPEDGNGRPHFVSQVTTRLEKRLAISGWFK